MKFENFLFLFTLLFFSAFVFLHSIDLTWFPSHLFHNYALLLLYYAIQISIFFILCNHFCILWYISISVIFILYYTFFLKFLLPINLCLFMHPFTYFLSPLASEKWQREQARVLPAAPSLTSPHKAIFGWWPLTSVHVASAWLRVLH